MNASRESGATLILSVMLLAAITVLVGLGRVAMYRNQVKLRLDREREIQQEFATRSAMRWLETFGDGLPAESVPFVFPTVRGNIGVVLRPADPVFPRRNVAGDFDIGKEGRNSLSSVGYVSASDGVVVESSEKGIVAKMSDKDRNAEIGGVHVLAIDIDESRAAALWTDNAYGLRYLIYLTDFCKPDPGRYDSDLLKFALTPKNASFGASGGQSGSSYAIWMTQDISKDHSVSGSAATSARLRLYARGTHGTGVESRLLSDVETFARDGSKGFQLSSTKASLAAQKLAGIDNDAIRKTHNYPVVDLEEKMWKGFVEDFEAACRDSGGVRLTAELEVRRERVSQDPEKDVDDYKTYVSKIAVTPAYEFETELAWTERGGDKTEEISTVIRVDPGVRGDDDPAHSVTYDTHGTYANRKNHLGDLTR